MKKLTLSLAALMACTLSFAQTDYSKTYTSNATLTAGDNASAAVIVIGGTDYDGMKAGTAKKAGTIKITVPANATNLHIHAIAWKGANNSTVNITGATCTPAALTLAANNGITGNSPFTISGEMLDDYYFNVKLTDITAETELTLSCDVRFVVFGVNAVETADVPATAIALSETTLTKEQYKYVKLTATLTPAEATTEVVWSSDNEEVATVANGVVTMVGVGNATITAKAGELTATCDITVTAATILTCAQAAEKALAVSANNELVADGKYVVHGYVIKEAGKGIEADFTKYGNYSFWMADDKDAEQGTFEAFQVAPADGTTLVQVGDYVEVVGELTKYNTTAETAPKTGTVKVITAHETAIETVEVSDIYANNGRIENIGNGRIYTISGVDVTEMNGQLKGIYVVKMNDKAHKVVVK